MWPRISATVLSGTLVSLSAPILLDTTRFPKYNIPTMTVYRRGKRGIYYMDFIIRGLRVKESTGKTRKREALLVETKRRAEITERLTGKGTPEKKAPTGEQFPLDNLTRNPSPQMKLKDAVERCYEERWKHTKSNTFTHNRAKSLVILIGNLDLPQITESVIEQMRSKLRRKRKAPATINRSCATLKTILLMANRRWKMLDRVPYIEMQKESLGRVRFLSEQEETKLLSLLQEHPIAHWRVAADIVAVLLDTGMRVGELLSLLVKDVNFESNLIHIWFNKADKPRSIPMTSRVREIMEKQCADRIGRVFPVKQDLLSRAWNSARKTMGLTNDPQFVPHALRHTCASRLVQAGVDLYTVQRYLGHSTIRVTERYAHLSPAMLRDAAQALEKPWIGVGANTPPAISWRGGSSKCVILQRTGAQPRAANPLFPGSNPGAASIYFGDLANSG